MCYVNSRMRPIICNYYLTYRCNACCGFCSLWNDGSVPRGAEADTNTVRANLDAVAHAGVKVVDFTGGEPLLYDDLPTVLSHARGRGLRTTVTTNGILYPDRARELTGNIGILQFSLHAADRAGHDSVTKTPSFDRILESVEVARSLGERPTFIHTVTDDTLYNAPDVAALARSLRVPLFFNPCFSYGEHTGLSREGIRVIDRLSRAPGITTDRGYLRFVLHGGNRRAKPACLAVSSCVVISPDNHLLLPCFHFKTTSLPIGGDLGGLLRSAEVAHQRALQGRHPFCEGCNVYCYMRASLFRRPEPAMLLSLLSAAKYSWEYFCSPRTTPKAHHDRGTSGAP